MECFTEKTLELMEKMGFTPIVLIGLLIASLTLILNLKTTNKFIQDFKNSSNIDKFINLIFYTSFSLLLLLIFSVISNYIVDDNILFVISISYLVLFSFLIYSLFTIVFILKEIVRTSLKD